MASCMQMHAPSVSLSTTSTQCDLQTQSTVKLAQTYLLQLSVSAEQGKVTQQKQQLYTLAMLCRVCWTPWRLQRSKSTSENALQGLLELMVSAEQVKGPSAEVSTLLSVCIRDSLETAFRWHIEQSSKDADNDAVRICLLAKAILNLLGIEVTTFSPVLMPYLPIAADVAAKALHELFASQLLPWLATGQLSHRCCYMAVWHGCMYAMSQATALP